MKSSGNNLLPSLNDYFKVVIPFQSKFYKIKNKYSYSGKAYLIFENNGKLVFNTAQLNENDDVIGANNYKDNYQSKDYLSSKPLIKKIRLQAFGHNQVEGKNHSGSKKGISKLKWNINLINEAILKERLTIKDVDGFISGSNSSGALTKPSNDPLRAKMINPLFKYDSIATSWNIFALFSALNKKSNNTKFSPKSKINLKFLDQIKEQKFEYLFKLNLQIIPYGAKNFENYYVSFEEAFLNHNINNFDFNFDFFYDLSIIQEEFDFKKNLPETYLIHLVNKINNSKSEYYENPRDFLNRQLRTMWLKNIENNIKINNFKHDFVYNISQKDRAHILENSKMLDVLMSFHFTDNEKEEKLELFFNENNYLLLPKNIHKYWDDNKIIIDDNGNILNNGLSEEEYQKLILSGHNIYNVYKEAKNYERILLLNKRNLII